MEYVCKATARGMALQHYGYGKTDHDAVMNAVRDIPPHIPQNSIILVVYHEDSAGAVTVHYAQTLSQYLDAIS